MIERILDYIAVDVGDRKVEYDSFDPLAAVRDEMGVFKDVLDAKHVAVDLDAGSAPKEWVGDLKAFRSATLELFSNAVKFAPENSRIVVSIQEVPGHLAIAITDEGPGMSDKFRAAAGERFNIGEPVLNRGGMVQGVGLGLALVTRIADLLGGRLTLGINRPRGTVATISFPRVQSREQAALSLEGEER